MVQYVGREDEMLPRIVSPQGRYQQESKSTFTPADLARKSIRVTVIANQVKEVPLDEMGNL